MKSVNFLHALFDSGDYLSMQVNYVRLGEVPPGGVFILQYNEKAGPCKEMFSDDKRVDPQDENTCGYTVWQTEYFPVTEFDKALQAFTARLKSSNPIQATTTGYRLEDIPR